MEKQDTGYSAPLQAPRTNLAMAEIVDTAIALMDEHGKDYATQYLIGRGVGFRIIERVLADPQFRRQRAA
jgi:hypothetical protein